MKYHLIVFGCQMNISDSERISAVLDGLKYKLTLNINKADLIVVAMCSVRQSAVDRVHGLAPKFKKLRTGGKKITTVLTGCVLQKDRKKMLKLFDYIINIKNITKLPEILKTKQKITQVHKSRDSVIYEPTQNDYLSINSKYSNKFSANVPIMTGCNNFCSYCVVPYARDKEISRPAEEIISEIKNLVKNNYKEIWLLGQNVNSYNGKDVVCHYDRSDKVGVGFVDFSGLLKIINDIPGDFWIRFTSSHPKDFSEELINTMTSCKKMTPYLNLPAQSGDDKILKSMNRHYTVAQYKNLVKKIRRAMPDISLSTDIIVGFPGETKKQFENTAKLFRDIKFDMAYINKYSPRPGTAAEKLKNNISPDEKKRREKVLTEILKTTALSHNKKLVGRETVVLIESKNKNYWLGKNEQYKTVKIQNAKRKNQNDNSKCKINNLVGKFVKIKITKAYEWALEGVLI